MYGREAHLCSTVVTEDLVKYIHVHVYVAATCLPWPDCTIGMEMLYFRPPLCFPPPYLHFILLLSNPSFLFISPVRLYILYVSSVAVVMTMMY